MLEWHRALLGLRQRLFDDSHAAVHASVQGKVLLVEREDLLLVAGFGEGPFAAQLPGGHWRVVLDSGAAQQSLGVLRGSGRHAIVLERA